MRKRALDGGPEDALSTTTTAEERLAMMWPLAVEAWSLTGRPMPEYGRKEAPVRWLRSRPPK